MPRAKTENKPSGDVAPKVKAKRQPRKGNVTREMTDGLASFVAIPFAVLMPQQALQAVETQALSVALYDAAQANPWIKSIILSMTGFGGASELALVAGAIALPRIVGRMPDTPQTAQLKMFTFAGSQFIVQSVLEKDKHVEAGRTSGAGGVNGLGKDDVSEGVSTDTRIRDDADVEGGADLMGEMESNQAGEPVKRARKSNSVHP